MATKIRRVKIADIQIPEIRATAQYDEEQREELARNIESEGQLVRPLLAENESGLILVDGLNRIRDATSKGQTDIECEIRPGRMEDVLVWNLSTTYFKGTPLVTEELQVIKALTDEFEMDSIAIAKRTGMSQNRIEQLQWVAKSSPAILSALDGGAIKLGHAAEMARYLTHDQQEMFLPLVLSNRWTIPQVHEYIQAVLERQGELAEHEPSSGLIQQQQVLGSCTACGEGWAPNKLSAILICPSCNGILQDAVRQLQRTG